MKKLFKFSIEAEADLDNMKHILNTDKDIKNMFHRKFEHEEVSLLYFIINSGIDDLIAQIPDIDEPTDDPFAKPNPDWGVMPPIFNGDDPFARPNGWTGGGAGPDLPDVPDNPDPEEPDNPTPPEPPTGEDKVEEDENPDNPEELA